MPRELFEVVCVPLMGVRYTVTLGISTPDDENNYYSTLFNIKLANGQPLFKVIPVGLSCDACREAGRAEHCPHRANIMPMWKSEEGQELQKQLLSSGDFRRESQGEIVATKEYAFVSEHVERLFKQKRVDIRGSSTNGMIFLAVDPSGGSTKKSELAMVAGLFTVDNDIIVSFSVFLSFLSSGHAAAVFFHLHHKL